jgi:hypothetical protein
MWYNSKGLRRSWEPMFKFSGLVQSSRIRDPGSGAFLAPGCGIGDKFFLDPRSNPYHFCELSNNFWFKISAILLV